jgi:peptidoglycan/LPS O-acetylase OafA/YrhL
VLPYVKKLAPLLLLCGMPKSSHTLPLHPKYRPDIDGLRAIAVLSVVAFHAFPEWISGGFIGVDIFFVISGYLISSILFESLDAGRFKLSEFYARRVLRIFPALILVLVSCFAFGWVTLLTDEFMQLGKHISAGAGFVSNLVFWNEAGYFDNSADTKPLLHLWSLGIEEQFYIVWPILLLLVWKRHVNFFKITIVLALSSFLINIVLMYVNPVADFYSPLSRFWELLVGASLAYIILYQKNLVNQWRKSSGVIAIVGLGLFTLGIVLLTKASLFPGWWALLPTLGGACLIFAGPHTWVNQTILSNRVFVWFGLISYPLYLWHWPMLAFSRIMNSGLPSYAVRVTAVLLSIVLAWLTYILLERNIRNGKRERLKTVVLLVLLATVGYVGFNTYSREGLPSRKVQQMLNLQVKSAPMKNMSYDCGINDESIKNLFAVCEKDGRGNVKYALIGDSKAQALYPGLVRTSGDQGRWLFIGGTNKHGATVPLLPTSPSSTPQFPLALIAVNTVVENKNIETVVLVASIRGLFSLSDGVLAAENMKTYDYTYLKRLAANQNYQTAFDGLSETISRFEKAGKRVVLVVDNPALPSPQDCLPRISSANWVNQFLGNKKNEACVISLEVFRQERLLYTNLLSNLKAKYPNTVEIFDPTLIYCDEQAGTCEALREGKTLYSYTDHISGYAADLVGISLNHYLNKK